MLVTFCFNTYGRIYPGDWMAIAHQFVRQELHLQDDYDREETLHGNDKFISVEDLWNSWVKNEGKTITTT